MEEKREVHSSKDDGDDLWSGCFIAVVVFSIAAFAGCLLAYAVAIAS